MAECLFKPKKYGNPSEVSITEIVKEYYPLDVFDTVPQVKDHLAHLQMSMLSMPMSPSALT